MVPEKVKSYLGFARKAGRLCAGYNTCIYQMKEISLLILAEEISDNSKEKLISIAEKAGTRCIVYGRGDELSAACGMEGRNIFGVKDKGLAEAILREI